MNEQFWYFLVHGFINEKQAAYTGFYAYGNHLGEAFEKVNQNKEKAELLTCELIEASRLDILEKFKLPRKAKEIAPGLFYKSGLSIYNVSDDDENFISPVGIVKASEDGEYEMEMIKEQFVAYSKDENGIYSFTMTIENKNLERVFLKSLEFIPSVEAVSFFIESEWENETETELWINKSLSTKNEIVEFLKENLENTIKNGFVSTVIYSSEGESNLVVDSHKHLKLTTKSEKVFNDFGKQIMELGYKQTKDFYTLEFGYHHWHYRPFNSLSKTEFKKYLVQKGFDILEN